MLRYVTLCYVTLRYVMPVMVILVSSTFLLKAEISNEQFKHFILFMQASLCELRVYISFIDRYF